MKRTLAIGLAGSGLTCLTWLPVATAQCTPEWDVTFGNPGLNDGYAGPIRAWDDGGGERIYVGGSFNGITGVGGTVGIARWNPGTSSWSPVKTGLSFGFTNGFLNVLVPFDPGSGEVLVAGGFFASAPGVADTKSIAYFDGTNWNSLGAGFPSNSANAIWGMTTWDDGAGEALYVGGSFTEIGGVTAGSIASWDGTSWSVVGNGAPLGGPFAPNVFSLGAYDSGSGDRLIAAGRYSTIGGVNTGMIAQWDGTSWTTVGSGLFPTSTFAGLECQTTFDDGGGDALYVAGGEFSGAGPIASVAKWDGSTWTAVGQTVGGRVTSIAVFDDGTGATLYIGGTATPGINYIARLEGGQWVIVAGGVNVNGGSTSGNFPSVFGLYPHGDKLYMGGSFKEVGGLSTNGLATFNGCPSGCYSDCDNSGTLDFFDFLCFQNAFATGQSYADCDASGSLDFFDFLCFQNAFAGGCP